MSDEVARGLLEAIVAAPDDDAPRLVYADYLTERGDPRGELIQLQCRLARGPHDSRIAERIAAVLDEHSHVLFADLARLELPGHFHFERGFIARLEGRFPAATTRCTEVLALAPLLRNLHLTIDGQRDRMALAKPRETAVLEQARSLSIHGKHVGRTRALQGPIADFAMLAELPFRELRELRVTRVRPERLPELLRSPALAGLDVLALRLRLDIAALIEIAEAFALPVLRELELGDIYGGSALAALADVPLPKLEVLRVAGLPSGNMLDRLSFPALRRIVFAHGVLLRDTARALHRWTGAPQLATIELPGTQIDGDALTLLRERFSVVEQRS